MPSFRRRFVFALGCLAILAAAWLVSRWNFNITNRLAGPLVQKTSTEYIPDYFRGKLPEFASKWYSDELRRLDERALPDSDSDDDQEVYRFLWLRSGELEHRPVVIRIQRSAQTYALVAKAPSESTEGLPDVRISRSVGEDEWTQFIAMLKAASFWDLPTRPGRRGLDGSSWIVEGFKAGNYHIVDLWTPQSGEFREACLYLLNLSGVKGDEVY